MVIVMIVIVIGLAAGAAALTETLSSRGHATRDERSARALQAADAGIQTELYRANQINLGSLKLTSGLSLSAILSQLATCPVPQINASGVVSGLRFRRDRLDRKRLSLEQRERDHQPRPERGAGR